MSSLSLSVATKDDWVTIAEGWHLVRMCVRHQYSRETTSSKFNSHSKVFAALFLLVGSSEAKTICIVPPSYGLMILIYDLACNPRHIP